MTKTKRKEDKRPYNRHGLTPVDSPVRGVSWYEAVAYAEFVGKSLPTVHHWDEASYAGQPGYFNITLLSNFGGDNPEAVGRRPGLGRFGTYDMAGNVKEWCWNPTGNRRYILGGSWKEPVYMYRSKDAQPPFDRSPTYGFRCAKYSAPLPVELTGPVDPRDRDYGLEEPAGDEVFKVYKSIYSYDPTELNPAVESIDDSPKYWRREKVSFNAAYGNERVIAYLYLPKNAVPPYQTVVYFPGLYALFLRSHEKSFMSYWDFVIRSDRALLHPIYQGTYERRFTSLGEGSSMERDLFIQWSKDLGRSIDYLETRPDIDHERLAYYGFSTGAWLGPIFTAIDERIKVSVLLSGGFWRLPGLAEVDPLHFAPRTRVPVLMLNGRNDFIFPLETTQAPLLRSLGAPEKHKRHVLFDSGHIPPRNGVVKETLASLDRYLGPVELRKGSH